MDVSDNSWNKHNCPFGVRGISRSEVIEQKTHWWSFPRHSAEVLTAFYKTTFLVRCSYYSLSPSKSTSKIPYVLTTVANTSLLINPRLLCLNPLSLGSHCFGCALFSGPYWWSQVSSPITLLQRIILEYWPPLVENFHCKCSFACSWSRYDKLEKKVFSTCTFFFFLI